MDEECVLYRDKFATHHYKAIRMRAITFADLLNRWPIRRKFALIGGCAVLMAAVPTALIMTNLANEERLVAAQREGLSEAQSVLKLLRLTQQHRTIAAMAQAGDEGQVAALKGKAAEVDAALDRLRVRSDEFTGAAEKVASEWMPLRQAAATGSIDPSTSLDQHAALAASELALLGRVADVSRIGLDREGETLHLAQMALLSLPALTERMSRMQAVSASALSHRGVSGADQATLSLQLDQMLFQLDAVRVDFQRVARSLSADNSALKEVAGSALGSAQVMGSVIDQTFLQQRLPSGTSAEYFGETTILIDAQFTMITQSFNVINALLAQQQSQSRVTMSWTIALMVGVAALAALMLVAIARSTSHSLAKAVQVARHVAEGDLRTEVEVTGSDEVGQLMSALRDMNLRLTDVVRRVRDGSDSVANASSEIAQGNLDLSQRTERQASALQQTAATMEELGANVRRNATAAERADHLARDASEVAARGGEVVAEVVDTMRVINDGSRKIGEIIGVIDGIAFQTNILALNAAVEAARAGEQGRGFAVVASEVRSLAGRSADAARQIRGLISASVEQVERGTALVARAGGTMEEVVTSIRNVTSLMSEINVASAVQRTGVAQVGEAINSMDTSTQQNSSLVEESAAAAESLSHEAAALVQAVAVFRIAV
ncbi:MAG TPA: methyl-accepting chemotaxis protein [Ideonella sp.]|uniref:methyl-accepting chemotaxis protein n=1 Tax=Ideonella sp. TaxID=1929293 RepID=UPI002C134C64|nr:methyl-accepting chemotaxis protein [Ideonella sp.]HSI51909.1 methyl-accepting chemotaxis protein [Ideonella sp.]